MIEQILCFLVLIICLVYGLALLSWLVMKLDIEKRRSKRTKFFEMIGGTLMEIEKLKDMLRNAAGGPVGIQMCQEAADALEQLQSENDRLKDELEKVDAEKDAVIKELNGVSSLVDDLAEFVDREIHPVVDYNLYLDLRENVDAVSMFQHEDEWRGLHKEE